MSVNVSKQFLRQTRTFQLAPARCLATASTSKIDFSQKLADGPSLDDFIAGDRIVLGNTRG